MVSLVSQIPLILLCNFLLSMSIKYAVPGLWTTSPWKFSSSENALDATPITKYHMPAGQVNIFSLKKKKINKDVLDSADSQNREKHSVPKKRRFEPAPSLQVRKVNMRPCR